MTRFHAGSVAGLTATAFCAGMLTFAGSGAAFAACTTTTVTDTTLSCAGSTFTSNTTNSDGNAASTSSRTQLFNRNILATISPDGDISNYGLSVVANGGGHTISVIHDGSVSAGGINLNPLATFLVAGDGGAITYRGNGAVLAGGGSYIYDGLVISNTGGGSIQVGTPTNPISANMRGWSALRLSTDDGNQSLYIGGGILRAIGFQGGGSAVRMAANGTGDIQLQAASGAWIVDLGQYNTGIRASTVGGDISVRSGANIGQASVPINFGITADAAFGIGETPRASSGNISIATTDGEIQAVQVGVYARVAGSSSNTAISIAPSNLIKVYGQAGLGTGIHADGGSQEINVAGTIDAAMFGIISAKSRNVSISVSGSVASTTYSAIAVSSLGPVIITNTGIVSGSTGMTLYGGNNTVSNSGTIRGADGNAIVFGGNNNVLSLSSGSAISGNVLGAGNDMLQLAGATNGSFDVGAIGAGAQYRGFTTLGKTGASTWTVTGVSAFAGATRVEAGMLAVNGSLAASAVTVQSGAVLGGTGTVGAASIQSGGTLAPGNSIGTLTVNGNLTLAPGATYAVEIAPDAADRTAVSGSASLDGVLAVTAASGTYAVGQRYTLISAGSGVTGTFSSFTAIGLPGYVRGRLDYDASAAYLYLDPALLAPQVSPAHGGIASGLDSAVQGGAVLPPGFSALYALSGAALDNALEQVSGQVGANTATAAAQSVSPFLMLMQSQGADPQGVRPAQLSSGAWRFWASAFGGHTGISANASGGAAGLSASNYGFAGGAEIGLDGDWTVGGSVAIGRQDFRSGNGTGKSDDVLLGLYARTAILGQGYIAAALGYGWHDIATNRVVTVLGTDVLAAKLDGQSLGGRIEAGYTLASDSPYEITPFAAFAGQNFDAPAYGETAASGSPVFALSYAARQTGTQQTELGARLARLFALDGGNVLSGSLRAAWAHQLEAAPFAVASFQGLPGSSFQVLGVRAATDTALLSLALDVREAAGLTYGVRLDTQLGAGTTIYGGMGTLAWRW